MGKLASFRTAEKLKSMNKQAWIQPIMPQESTFAFSDACRFMHTCRYINPKWKHAPLHMHPHVNSERKQMQQFLVILLLTYYWKMPRWMRFKLYGIESFELEHQDSAGARSKVHFKREIFLTLPADNVPSFATGDEFFGAECRWDFQKITLKIR